MVKRIRPTGFCALFCRLCFPLEHLDQKSGANEKKHGQSSNRQVERRLCFSVHFFNVATSQDKGCGGRNSPSESSQENHLSSFYTFGPNNKAFISDTQHPTLQTAVILKRKKKYFANLGFPKVFDDSKNTPKVNISNSPSNSPPYFQLRKVSGCYH